MNLKNRKKYIKCEEKTKLSHFQIYTLIVKIVKHLVRIIRLIYIIEPPRHALYTLRRLPYEIFNIIFCLVNVFCEEFNLLTISLNNFNEVGKKKGYNI